MLDSSRPDKYQLSYDRGFDLLEIRVLDAGKPIIADEIRPNIFVHKDDKGQIAGFTILHFSEMIDDPKLIVSTPSLPDNVRELVHA